MVQTSPGGWLHSSLLKKFSATLGTRVIVLGLGLINGIIIARILLPEGRGLLAVAVTLQAIGVQLGHLGFHTSNTLFVARDPKTLPRVFSNTLVVSLVFGLLAAVVVGVWSLYFSEEDPLDALLLAACLGSIPLGIGFLLIRNLLLARNEVRAFNQIELTISVVSILLLGMLFLLGEVTPFTVFLASVCTGLVGTCLAIARLRRSGRLLVKPELGLFRDQFRIAYRSYLSCIFSFLVLKFDILLIQHHAGVEEVGWYVITSNYADKLLLVPSTLGLVLFPKLASIVSTRERWAYTRSLLGVFTIAMLALTGVACAVFHPLVRHLYGPEYLPAVPAFLYLSIGVVALAAHSLYMNHFAASGMPLVVIFGPLAGFVVNIVLNTILIPEIGIDGAAISSSISYGLMLLIALVYERLRGATLGSAPTEA